MTYYISVASLLATYISHGSTILKDQILDERSWLELVILKHRENIVGGRV